MRDEDHPAGDAAPRRVSQPGLAARAYRRRAWSGWGRPASPRRASRPTCTNTWRRACSASDPLEIEALHRDLIGYLGCAARASRRARPRPSTSRSGICSARSASQPLYQLLGGASRERIRTYNTCAGYRYVRARRRPGRRQLGTADGESRRARTRTSTLFCIAPTSWRESLLEQGITGMKIWPFDPYAEATRRPAISPPTISTRRSSRSGKIRKAVGNRDGHHGRVALAVEPADGAAHRAGARGVRPLLVRGPDPHGQPRRCSSDFAAGTHGADQRLARRSPRAGASASCSRRGAAGIVMFDSRWCGGISEATKIATHGRGLAAAGRAARLHRTDRAARPRCTSRSARRTRWCRRSVRAFYSGWYKELVTHVPQPVQGYFGKPPGPGIGAELLPDVWKRKDASVRISPA